MSSVIAISAVQGSSCPIQSSDINHFWGINMGYVTEILEAALEISSSWTNYLIPAASTN